MTLIEQYTLMECLLNLANWFRELLSIFGALNNPETRGFCLRRLHELIPIMTELEEFSKQCPSWVPRYTSSSTFQSNATSGGSGRGRPASRKATAGKAGKRPTSTQPPNTQMAKSQNPLQSQAAATQTSSVNQSAITNFTVLTKFRTAFRELSLDAIQLIAGEVVGNNTTDENSPVLQMSASTANSSFSTIFTPQEALYLVEDLLDKLKYKLIKSGSKAFGHFAGAGQLSLYSEMAHRCLDEKSLEEVMEYSITLVPHMCSLLQGCYVMLYETLNESEGTLDTLEKRPEWSSGLKLYGCVLDCLTILLVNTPSVCPDSVNKLIFLIANSAQSDESRTPNGNTLYEAFNFLYQFSNCLPTLLVAGSYLRAMEALVALSKRGPMRSNCNYKIRTFLCLF